MEFEKVINERYSSRKFKSQKISKDQIEAILHAAKVAPTAVNKQPFHIWVISSQDSLDKVSQTTKFTFGAPVIFVLGSKSDQAWVRKYDATGEEGLYDKRGRHKTDDEVHELERLRRENKRLKRQLEENDMLVQLLKKVKEFEGM